MTAFLVVLAYGLGVCTPYVVLIACDLYDLARFPS